MMKDGHLLASAANQMVPNYETLFRWGDTWTSALDTGRALEWTMLSALASQAQIYGWKYYFPLLSLPIGKSLYPLWNELPRQHGGLPGNTGAIQHRIRLRDRFLQAFVPKLIIEKAGSSYSVFREGCPYHKLMTDIQYDERPDIVLIAGNPTPGFPKIAEDESEVIFSFDLADGIVVSGGIRILNSMLLLCRWREPRTGAAIPISGIVECSVNKSTAMAQRQLSEYQHIFGSTERQLPIVLVTGNDLPLLNWPQYRVDLETTNIDVIERDCRTAADLALATFGII